MNNKTSLPQKKEFNIVEMMPTVPPSRRAYYVWHCATGKFVGRWEGASPTLKQIRTEWVARRLYQ